MNLNCKNKLLKLNREDASQEIIEEQIQLLDDYIFELYGIDQKQIAYIKERFS